MTLGQKIKTARLERGMTQKELVGDYITRNMLSKIEHDSAMPSVRTLEYLARALDLPTSDFLDGSLLSDGSAADGLDEARAAFRTGQWLDCLSLLNAAPTAASTDEGYLLQARAGASAARAALERGDFVSARELSETAQYYNQEGMYFDQTLGLELSLVLGRALISLGETGYEMQRTAFLEDFAQMEESFRDLSGREGTSQESRASTNRPT
ncbi:MAG: helix-turn-helix domain-containing protein [Oscillospiraceae bacterium]|nr:helix-turn-helix domain-containing protein [Oscillospiraceae bacterium]